MAEHVLCLRIACVVMGRINNVDKIDMMVGFCLGSVICGGPLDENELADCEMQQQQSNNGNFGDVLLPPLP